MKSEILQRAKGVRDFGPKEKIARNKIVQTLQQVFESFGFNPIETPIIERSDLFASKFGIGEESDAMKETFKLKDQGLRDLVLRTEFTVPFARFVGMNPQFKKPFKRYQIGQVYRDGPIKLGRYREFWQCDVDVVGESDLFLDAEILQLVSEAFVKLGIAVEVQINNRKILNAILNYAGIADADQVSVIISIDKLDKVGRKGVQVELENKGIAKENVATVLELITLKGNNKELLEKLETKIGDNEGISEVRQVLENVLDGSNINFVPSLARGLAYYTGNVFEVYLEDKTKFSSSVCGGGRYDSMIGGFLEDGKVYPSVGISFGLETIFDALSLSENKEMQASVVDVYIVPMKDDFIKPALKIAKTLRALDVNTDISYVNKKFKKGMEYANTYKIPWVIILGEDEIKSEKVMLRNMKTGDQKLFDVKEVAEEILKFK